MLEIEVHLNFGLQRKRIPNPVNLVHPVKTFFVLRIGGLLFFTARPWVFSEGGGRPKKITTPVFIPPYSKAGFAANTACDTT